MPKASKAYDNFERTNESYSSHHVLVILYFFSPGIVFYREFYGLQFIEIFMFLFG